EIAPAIISITLVMAAVFLPIGFMEGPSGIFYRQFAYTLAVAILISATNALTLSPALCALILRPPKKAVKESESEENAGVSDANLTVKDKVKAYINRFFIAFNTSFEAMTGRYIKAIKFLSKRMKLAIGGLVLVSIIGFLLMRFTPTAFIPTEDDGFIAYSVQLPPGSSLARTTNVLNEAIDILKDRKEIQSMSSSSGYNGIDGSNSTSYAIGYINMYPSKQRKGIKSIYNFIDTVRKDLSQIKEASINVFMRPTVSG